MSSELNIGGQAVIEGVMMRSKRFYSLALRRKSGEIETSVTRFVPLSETKKIFSLPVLRGFSVLIDSMKIGWRTLNHSADTYARDMVDEKVEEVIGRKVERKTPSKGAGEIAMLAFSVIFGFFIFVYLPLLLARKARVYFFAGSDVFFIHLLDGGIKLLIFFAYIFFISFFKDVKRIFRYHGAEHMTIHAAEAGGPELSVENIKGHDRTHIRCGTNFLFTVVVVGIIVHAIIRTESQMWNFIIRLAMIPLISGISYELIKYAFRNESAVSKIIFAPGLLFQKITTAVPDEGMIEVALSAFRSVKQAEEAPDTSRHVPDGTSAE